MPPCSQSRKGGPGGPVAPRRGPRAGPRGGGGGLGFSPLSNYLLSPLEERFPLYRGDAPITGVIILGGAEVADVGIARGVPAYANAGERAIAFGALARKYPDARLVFSGGNGKGNSETLTEARMTMIALPELGIAPERVEFESRSRNTAENALFSKELLKPGRASAGCW